MDINEFYERQAAERAKWPLADRIKHFVDVNKSEGMEVSRIDNADGSVDLIVLDGGMVEGRARLAEGVPTQWL